MQHARRIARRIVAVSRRADLMADVSELAWDVFNDTGKGRVMTPTEAARLLKKRGPRGGWPLDLLDDWPPG